MRSGAGKLRSGSDDYSGGPENYATFEDNPNAATCGGTIHPCPTPAPEKVGPATSVASKFHVTSVPVVGTGFDKWNPHTPEGRIHKELFGSAPEIDYLADTQPSPEVIRAVIGFIPVVNSVLVFNDPKATTFDKTLAVGTDVLAVVGVGAVVKLGAKGVGLAKGVVLGAEVAEDVAQVGGAARRTLVFADHLLRKGLMKEGHAAVFGVMSGCTKEGCATFARALDMFVNDTSIVEISAKYRGFPAIHFFNPATGVVVVANHAGNYVTGVQLGASQLEGLLLKGGWQ